MNLSLGIVGLPNVGKSTLFNSLTRNEIPAENYPFCTIDPNHGVVQVEDERLKKIAEVINPAKITPAVVEFVDIAGLVKGASEGEGLGNKFLANIREVSSIIHLVRDFRNDNITHVEESIDPKRDIELINTELILKDIESVEGRVATLTGKSKSNPKLKPHLEYMENLLKHLSDGGLAYDFELSSNDDININRKELFLLTDKPVIYLVNTTEDRFEESSNIIKSIVGDKLVIPMDVKQEAELASMADDERVEFMNELGLTSTGLQLLTLEAYKLLGLISYFTAGPTEVRAWTISVNTHAPEAAGVIHTDIQKNFIAADVVDWKDFVEFKGWVGAKEKGKVRLEGKPYIVNDGDVILFKHNG